MHSHGLFRGYESLRVCQLGTPWWTTLELASSKNVPLSYPSGQLSNWYPLVDNFGTFEWLRASDLKELVVGSRV